MHILASESSTRLSIDVSIIQLVITQQGLRCISYLAQYSLLIVYPAFLINCYQSFMFISYIYTLVDI